MAKKKDKGYVLVHRQIFDSYIWKNSEPFDRRSAWVDLILMANHEERSFMLRNGKNQVVGEGQIFTSMEHLAQRWHWSRNRVIRYLHILSEQGMCTVTGTTVGTTITLEKYGFYQHKRTTNGATNGTTDGATDGATDGTRTIHYKQYTNNTKHEKQESADAPDCSSGGYDIE